MGLIDGNKLGVSLSTSNDSRFPGLNILDSDVKTFWLTTGMFPQEIIVTFNKSYIITKAEITCGGIRSVTFEKSVDTQAINFTAIVDATIDDTKDENLQKESYQLQDEECTFMKIKINSAWEDFAAIHSVKFYGDIKT